MRKEREYYMNNRHLNGWLLALFVVLMAPHGAEAAPQAFVSVFGADFGDCSTEASPCRTLAFAISGVDADGSVIVLNSGSYGNAPITIFRSVRVIASGVVALSQSPITVNVVASDTVVLSGLTMTPSTPGFVAIRNLGDGAVYVEHCVIDGWAAGIVLGGFARVYILDTIVKNSVAGDGLASGIGTAPRVTIRDSRFEDNRDCGVDIDSPAFVSVSHSVSSGNQCGFVANHGGSLTIQDSAASSNTSGFEVGVAGSVMRVTRSVATANGTGFRNLFSGTFESLGDNLVRGNLTDVSGAITIVPGN
jgi:hypothetical protein